ncbi:MULTISPECIES: heparan-alpha-glucosaminide N-acetyltransferase [Halocynthiibacter]|uniref:DUF1624 domain-containing protein n=1 Tax=Halocynthiibacter halioticoli TaxID=2986804 RepID=A0AAE3LQT5_9RHOB|nr:MULTISPECIES: heparan-alpha-glucosaminide N-acetyltransferase [Halocynthiibacter]MCV6824817.1 DUF1624 domain-containing protein [Halocynthiibacter halioticoli]MCW4057818.1 DUF1624 domain-containing protein [Halocynthiibacter sp. SDUM655004]
MSNQEDIVAEAHNPHNARIPSIDIARTAALFAMIIYHFFWDLAALGFIAPDTMYASGWVWFAKCIAASFLFLAGFSLWLAHGENARWRPFWRRLGILALAAVLISVVTYFAFPNGWIRFGILHSIAASSLIGMLLLRSPSLVLLGLIVLIYALNNVELVAFNAPLLIWTGLGTQIPYMLDYEPLIPWLAALLAGLLTAKLIAPRLPLQTSAIKLPAFLVWPGRHSLMIYLLHQPILYGTLLAVKNLFT